MFITIHDQLIDQQVSSDFPVKIKRQEYDEPGPILKRHWHEECMIIYIEKGNAVIHCNSQSITAAAGDLIIINSNDMHYVENCCTHLIECYLLVDFNFLRSHTDDVCQLKYIAPLLQNRVRFQNKIEDPALIQLVLELFREYQQKLPGFELLIKAGLYHILVLLLRRYTVPAGDEVQHRRQHQLRPVLEYIAAHYERKITLKELADMANMSGPHLCRLFKTITGLPPVAYINQLRINAAMKLLQQQHMLPVCEIALSVGFNDSNYFSRLFKRYKNISPSSLQKENILNI